MKLVATSHVPQKKTTESLDPLGSEQMVPLDPLGSVLMVPAAPVVEKLMVVETPNLGGEIGSADAPPEVLTQFSPMKRAPTPVIANKPVDSTPPFCPIATYEDMRSQMTVDLDIQQNFFVIALETIQPGKKGSNLVLDAVANMVSLVFNV
jgi:hypothetical protein